MSKILVTGASGFIGNHLVATLVARGDEVTCLVRKTSLVDPLRKLGVRFAYGDVADHDALAAAVANQDVVYHLAGCTKTIVGRRFDEVNHQGMANIAQACAQRTTPPTLLIVSSLAAAGPVHDGRPRVETDPLHPISHYGRSKRAGECAAEALANRVPITVVRPPMVIGEADLLSLPLFRSVARFRVHMMPRWREHRISVIHADDLANLLILAAQRGQRLLPHREGQEGNAHGYYFAASDEDPFYSDLGRMMAEAANRRVLLIIPTMPPVVWTVATVGEAIARICRKPIVMNFDKAREITGGLWLCSAQKAADELGFHVAAPLCDRIRQTMEWYLHEKWV
jgi:nucleoside-diphosphate-sugar epimerase